MTTSTKAKHLAPSTHPNDLLNVSGAFSTGPLDTFPLGLSGAHSEAPTEDTKLSEIAARQRDNTPEYIKATWGIYTIPYPNPPRPID